MTGGIFIYFLGGFFHEDEKTKINRTGERTPIRFILLYIVNTGGMLWQRRD